MTTYTIIYQILIMAVLYYVFPMRLRWMVLLAFSFGLYASGGGQAVCYILCAILSTYCSAFCIERIGMRKKEYVREHKELSS